MATEIERKFLVEGAAWRHGAEGKRYRQGYLSTDKVRTVRVRTIGDAGFLTIKGETRGISRLEFDYSIPGEEAESMLEALCFEPIIDKTRYRVQVGEHVWEVDEFHGVNAGLIVAEIELGSEDEAFERPDWLGAEVSDDPRYFNSNLVEHPYTTW
ncbi:MAG: CYTH domain-containing protein [Gammaproteobacteria bacterium]|nr:MAG: CYTH domain-containing protein [Gammaproteobacteria bacterium]